jgi:uncharacterized protein
MPIFEWNTDKAKVNLQKHKTSFELARLVFADPFQINDFDKTIDGEDRYYTLGQIGGVVLNVVHCYRENKNGEEIIRIISARKAEKRERSRYDSQTSR